MYVHFLLGVRAAGALRPAYKLEEHWRCIWQPGPKGTFISQALDIYSIYNPSMFSLV